MSEAQIIFDTPEQIAARRPVRLEFYFDHDDHLIMVHPTPSEFDSEDQYRDSDRAYWELVKWRGKVPE